MLGLSDRMPLRDRPPAAKKRRARTARPGSEGFIIRPNSIRRGQAPERAAGGRCWPSAGRTGGGIYEFRSDKWAELYNARIEEMITALKSKGVPVLWVGLPAVRGAKFDQRHELSR